MLQAGPLRVEKCSHRTGFDKPDVKGRLAPVQDPAAPPPEGDPQRAVRGAGPRYGEMPDELATGIDVPQLLAHLNSVLAKTGVVRPVPSLLLRAHAC